MSVLFSSRNYSTGTRCFGAVSGSLTGLAWLGSASWLDFPYSEAVTFGVDAGHFWCAPFCPLVFYPRSSETVSSRRFRQAGLEVLDMTLANPCF